MEDRNLRDGIPMDNRERLVHAAARLFAERGYADTSVEDLLEATGVARSNFYYHFDGKRDLARDVVDRWAERFHRELEEAWSAGGSDRERLRAAFRLARDGAPETGGDGTPLSALGGLAFQLAPHDGAVSETLAGFLDRLHRRLEEVVPPGGEASRDGGGGEERVRAVSSALVGSLVTRHAFPAGEGTVPGAEALARVLGGTRNGR